MTKVDLFTWVDYAVYRALQGLAIPSPCTWDNARTIGFEGGNYQKHRYFEKAVFDMTPDSQFFELSRIQLNPDLPYFKIRKFDGGLGLSGVIGTLFNEKPSKPAYFLIELADIVAKRSITVPLDLETEDFWRRSRTVLLRLQSLLLTCDSNDFHFALTHSNDKELLPRQQCWKKISSAVECHFAEHSYPEDLPLIAGQKVIELFGLPRNELANLLVSNSSDVELLGGKYWFLLMHSHCFSPKIYNIILDSAQIDRELSGYVHSPSDRVDPPSEVNIKMQYDCDLENISQSVIVSANPENAATSSADSTLPSLSYSNLYDICDITGKTFSEVFQASKELGVKPPFTLVAADRLAFKLCGTPSIRRVYEEYRVSRASNPSGSSHSSLAASSPEPANGAQIVSTSRGNEAENGTQKIETSLRTDYRRVPIFEASKAPIPEGIPPTGNERSDLECAIANPIHGFRSFFNDLPLIEGGNWIEDTLFVPAFNERLYSQLVVEYHRLSLSQIRDKKSDIIKQAERKGAGVGALIGFITSGGIMAPFMAMMGSNLSKMAANNIDPSRPIEEYLPDPHLLFLKDEGSYTALREASQSTSLKRRICLRRVELENGNLYWDVIPMILMDRQAVPAQVFKWGTSYFLRPISAGLTPGEVAGLGYNPFMMRRSLSYHPAHDIHPPIEFFVTSIVGPTIHKQPVVFKTGLREDRSFAHCYFDYPKDSQIF